MWFCCRCQFSNFTSWYLQVWALWSALSSRGGLDTSIFIRYRRHSSNRHPWNSCAVASRTGSGRCSTPDSPLLTSRTGSGWMPIWSLGWYVMCWWTLIVSPSHVSARPSSIGRLTRELFTTIITWSIIRSSPVIRNRTAYCRIDGLDWLSRLDRRRWTNVTVNARRLFMRPGLVSTNKTSQVLRRSCLPPQQLSPCCNVPSTVDKILKKLKM